MGTRPNDEGISRRGAGAEILPIPPALKFPFPSMEVEPQATPSLFPAKSLDTENPDKIAKASPTTVFPPSPTDSPDGQEPKSGPAQTGDGSSDSEFMQSSRKSRFGIGGRRSTKRDTIPENLAWDPDVAADASSSSSSSDEDISNAARRPSAARRASKGEKKDTHKGAKASRMDDFSKFAVGNDNFRTKGRVSKTSGRLDISLNEISRPGYLAKVLGSAFQQDAKQTAKDEATDSAVKSPSSIVAKQPTSRPDLWTRLTSFRKPPTTAVKTIPQLNIVVMVIGSRGDIQPFLKIGKELKERGHRVRIATHPAFKTFVEQDTGLEFFSVGGDPAELMAFMVKNPGLVPSASTIRAGEIGKKRDAMFEMFQGFWRACINATDEEPNEGNRIMMKDRQPFVADAIIANPPSFAHIHCAERLGIPLHLMFTFPYSPTQQFPHPLANIKRTNVDTNYTNFISYPLVEMMTWQGLGDLVNRFRVDTLGLEPVSTLWAPGQLFRLKVPYTYLWSPGLIPKPSDWGPEIDIAGFVFLDLASSYKPPKELKKFLGAGKPPVYIGFGSIVVDDPDRFTSLIFEAVAKAGVRALVSKGWGGLGGMENTPDNIFMLENTPHDWLFPRVSAVVHHGGAGTTAIGLKCGKPTMIVPFFGDQPFWGAMVARAGAGAQAPIPYKHLTVDALAEGITQCLLPEAKAAAEKLARDIAIEGDGAANAIESFHRHLPMEGNDSMRCSILQERVAVWELKMESHLRLSALAAQLLIDKKKIKLHDLRLIRHKDWNDFEGPGEPLTGGGAALLKSAHGIVTGVGSVPVRWGKRIRKRKSRTQQQEQVATLEDATKKATVPPLAANDDKKATSKLVKRTGEQVNRDQNRIEKDKSRPVAKSPSNGSTLTAPTKLELSNEADRSPSRTSKDSRDNIAQDLAADAGTGLAKTGEALAKVPMDLALAVAQGFHNAPRLYGDSTVRTPRRISGMKSGLRAAGEEFAYGVYDGVTGLVLQPYYGVKKDGVKGLVPGIGKGFFGFVLKDLAAIIGPIGYTLKGVHKEMVKSKQPTAFIRRARLKQGGKGKDSLKKAQLQEIEARVEKAWATVVEIMKEIDRTKEEGLSSRWAIAKQRRQFEKTGAFESVETAEQAFQIWKREREREREGVASNTTTHTTTAPAAAERPTPSRGSSRNRKEAATAIEPLANERPTTFRSNNKNRKETATATVPLATERPTSSRSNSRNRKETAIEFAPSAAERPSSSRSNSRNRKETANAPATAIATATSPLTTERPTLLSRGTSRSRSRTRKEMTTVQEQPQDALSNGYGYGNGDGVGVNGVTKKVEGGGGRKGSFRSTVTGTGGSVQT